MTRQRHLKDAQSLEDGVRLKKRLVPSTDARLKELNNSITNKFEADAADHGRNSLGIP